MQRGVQRGPHWLQLRCPTGSYESAVPLGPPSVHTGRQSLRVSGWASLPGATQPLRRGPLPGVHTQCPPLSLLSVSSLPSEAVRVNSKAEAPSKSSGCHSEAPREGSEGYVMQGPLLHFPKKKAISLCVFFSLCFSLFLPPFPPPRTHSHIHTFRYKELSLALLFQLTKEEIMARKCLVTSLGDNGV